MDPSTTDAGAGDASVVQTSERLGDAPGKPPVGRNPGSAESAVLNAVRPEDDASNVPRVDVNQVLIAEDDAVSRRLLQQSVHSWGYTSVCVQDGASALSKLSAPNGPRMAILDWEMPGLSGPQVCRILRARTASPYVYLVLLTARTAREHLVTGLASGADDYVLKPFDPMELQLRMRTGQRIVELQQELLEARMELERRANHDALTGALNRGAVLTEVEAEAARSARQGSTYCLILFDLDFFKRVNDTYGHRAGDMVLREVVRRSKIELRPYDVLGRYGGEEFMVLLPGCELRAGAVVADRLRKALANEAVAIDGRELPVTASFGIVCSSQPHATLEMLVDSADSALYRAKAGGRNRIELARPTSTSPPASKRLSVNPRSRLSFAVSQGVPRSSPATSEAAAGPILNPIFDRSVLAQVQDLVEDGSNFLQDLFAKYMGNAEATVVQLRSEELVADKKRRAAHALRGSSLSIGAAGVAEACRRIERALRMDPRADLGASIEILEGQLYRVRERYPLEIMRMTSRAGQSAGPGSQDRGTTEGG